MAEGDGDGDGEGSGVRATDYGLRSALGSVSGLVIRARARAGVKD